MPDCDHVVVAVSGGADSITLLDLFIRYQSRDNRFKLTAAHFNHRLRPEANEEQGQVERFCRERGVSFQIGSGDVAGYALSEKLAIHAAARDLRYRFLTDVAAKSGTRSLIATGHHRDDQIETVLMKLFSGSGVEGLSGIARSFVWSGGVTVIRPLLEFRREQIESYCEWRELPVVYDDSNLDMNYPRNRIRQHIVPLIEREMGASSVEGIVRSAKLMSLTSKYVTAHLGGMWRFTVKFQCEHEFVLDRYRFCSYLTLLRLRTLQDIARTVGSDMHRRSMERMESADRLIQSGRNGTVELGGEVKLFCDKRNIYIYRTVDAEESVESVGGNGTVFPEFGALSIVRGDAASDTVPPPEGVLICDGEKMGTDTFTIKRAEAGDRMSPFGMNGRRKISDILREQGIPQHRRNYPLIWSNDRLAAIPPFRIADQFKVTAATKRLVKFIWHESELMKFYRADSA